MNLPVAVSLILLVLSFGVSAQLPDELAHLEALASEQDELVSATRRFDLQQQGLLEWALALVDEFMLQGKSDLAATPPSGIRKRVGLLRTA